MAHETHGHGEHGANIRAYIAVFAALTGLTIISFIANTMVRGGSMSATTAFIIILGVAIVKAFLVAFIFMHVKWDWGKLYFMIVPSFILAPFLVLALLPDIVLYWKNLPGK